MTSIKDRYLELQIVADILGCTERHIRNLVFVEKELVAIKVGSRALRISEQSLISFIDRKKVNPEDMYDPDLEQQPPPTHTAQVARSKWIGR